MIGIGVIGFGYWGPNLVRNFNQLPDARMQMVSDLSEDRLKLVKRQYPAVHVTTDANALINDPQVNAVCVATPVAGHFELALAALLAGKHVFIEKPMTATSKQAEILIEEADKRNLTLMVDHTFIYMGAVRKIKELIDAGELGDLLYYDSTRVNLGLFQQDVNVLWDLAVHDLSLIHHFLPCKPIAVSATGMAHVPGQPENVAFLTLFFPCNIIAHVNVSWLSPVKLRMTLIGGTNKMVVFDDLHHSEKIRVYDKGVSLDNSTENVYQAMVAYRTGDMWAPQYEQTEALKVEAAHFIDCIENGKTPVTDGEMGLNIIRILEAADKSLKEQGYVVRL
jgi:predicted dehydrogenase